MTTALAPPRTRERLAPPVAYALFALIGLSTGANGVLLLAQMDDYGVDRTTIGLTFLTFSCGFVLAGLGAGPLVHRYGTRLALTISCGLLVAACLYQAVRPPFAGLVLVQLAGGFAIGLMESVLNAHLSERPDAPTLLGRLHAFFGVGALVGPAGASWLVGLTSWPVALLVLALLYLPVSLAAWAVHPPRAEDPFATGHASGEEDHGSVALLPAVLRQPAVLLAAVLLVLYVGIEIGIGSWGVSYLVEARHTSDLVAGYALSGFWLGLTIGRFTLAPLAARVGWSTTTLMYLCLSGVAAAATVLSLVAVVPLAAAALVLLGFFLGPVFPTLMAIAAQLATPRLAATAIGVLNAAGVIGGALLPWLEGAVAEGVGAWTLAPLSLGFAAVQLLVWWRVSRRLTSG